MASTAGTRGLWRALALTAAAALCGALGLATFDVGAAGAQTASASAKRSVCLLKYRNRAKKAKGARKSSTPCLPPAPGGSGGTTDPGSGTVGGGSTGGGTTGGGTTPPSTGNCDTPAPGSTSDFLTPQSGSHLIWHDNCASADPLPLYGAFVGARKDGRQNMFTNSVSQIADGRLSLQSSGGPGNVGYRKITVQPGDQNWGIRDALGYNWGEASDAGWGIAGPGPTVLWHEGEYHELTTWVQLGSINTTGYFRQLLEIKQSEPYTENPSRGAMFELQQREGNWKAICQWSDTWTIPVTQSPGTWVPISVEGLFSADPSKGWIRFKIGNQTSPIFHRQTLLRDTSNGASVPSFMELGPYQDPSLPQFSLGFADVRVYG